MNKKNFITFILIPFIIVVLLDLNSFSKSSDSVQRVKNNMKLFQKLIENYANENEGQFPDNQLTLYIEGNKKIIKELENMKNPMQTQQYSGIFSILDYINYYISTRYKKNKCYFAGFVLYEPTEVIGNQKILTSNYTYGKYRIYGTDDCGELIKENGKIFILERKKFHPKADLKIYKMFNSSKKIEKGNN